MQRTRPTIGVAKYIFTWLRLVLIGSASMTAPPGVSTRTTGYLPKL